MRMDFGPLKFSSKFDKNQLFGKYLSDFHQSLKDKLGAKFRHSQKKE